MTEEELLNVHELDQVRLAATQLRTIAPRRSPVIEMEDWQLVLSHLDRWQRALEEIVDEALVDENNMG